MGRYGYYDATGKLNVVEYGSNEQTGFVAEGDGILVRPITQSWTFQTKYLI